MSVTRRNILAGAALAALPVAATAAAIAQSAPDPILALIDAHRAADAAVHSYAKSLGGEDIPSDCPVFDRLSEDESQAAWNLMCSNTPTTVAGVIAVLSYVANGGPSKGYEWPNLWRDDEGKVIDPVIDMISNAAFALETIISGTAA